MEIKKVRCCGLDNPIGLDDGKVDFSWQLDSGQSNVVQQSYRIIVRDENEKKCVWDSENVRTARQNGIVYEGEKLISNRDYSYQIYVTDNYGNEAGSTAHHFALGIGKEEWKAKWIGCQSKDLDTNRKMASKEEMVQAFFP